MKRKAQEDMARMTLEEAAAWWWERMRQGNIHQELPDINSESRYDVALIRRVIHALRREHVEAEGVAVLKIPDLYRSRVS